MASKLALQRLNINYLNNFLRRQSKASSLAFGRNFRSTTGSNQEPAEAPSTAANTRIPYKNSYERDACNARREWVEQYSGCNLENVSSWWPSEKTDTTILQGNIENCIGLAKIPIGVAGPLEFNGLHVQGPILAPMATTEGVLVAAICRGTKALNLSGGVKTCATHQRMNRAPMFICGDPVQALLLGEWIQSKKDVIQNEIISKQSRHAKLKEIIAVYERDACHLSFRYETGDAAGQNQTTTCTWMALKWILENVEKDLPPDKLQIVYYTLDSNLSGDKKSNGLNGLLGRGVSVTAEVEVPEDVLKETCHLDSETFVRYMLYAQQVSSRMHHHAFNGNVSNIIAGIYTATGQDIACVVESSTASLTVMPRTNGEGGIKMTMYMPCLIIGTVGGGTALPTQKECLEIMGCYGPGKVKRLAEIIAGYSLALDLATWSSMAAGKFAEAHESMGRNRPQH